MKLKALVVGMGIMVTSVSAHSWELPPDKGTLDKEGVAAILAANEYPETSGYRQKIDYIDFSAYGQKFTQVVVTLTPDKPRLHQGKKLVVVGGEPGSEYAMDFVYTAEGKEGPGVWLAKRGVTFVALTRVGRWNFLAPTGDGSWESVPLAERMPIFHRDQKTHWSKSTYEVKDSGAQASGGDSAIYRIPKEGTDLQKQMLAATANTFIDGYRRGIEHVLPKAERDQSFVLFWGMSTGGSTLFPLAKYYTPDGYLGWGTSSTGLAYVYRRAKNNDYRQLYAQSAVRLRERGIDDFEYYTKELDKETRMKWWQVALKGPRFKSTEDAPMQFGAAALTETALRLWLSDFLPAEYRKDGLGKFVQDILEPSFPPAELKKVAILEVNGTKDEAIPPRTVDLHREVMEPYARKYRVGRIEGMQHYLFTQDSVKVVGTTWFKYIASGYFD